MIGDERVPVTVSKKTVKCTSDYNLQLKLFEPSGVIVTISGIGSSQSVAGWEKVEYVLITQYL